MSYVSNNRNAFNKFSPSLVINYNITAALFERCHFNGKLIIIAVPNTLKSIRYGFSLYWRHEYRNGAYIFSVNGLYCWDTDAVKLL